MKSKKTVKSPEKFSAAAKSFAKFCATIAALRHPKTGCPWDLQQTHRSLRRYMIEEANEAAEAMSHKDYRHIKEELGDVLLQVVLNAQLGADANTFTIEEVISGINAKMLRRHPHVFGDQDAKNQRTKREIRANWERVKAAEKTSGRKDQQTPGFFAAKASYPSTLEALSIGKAAAKINFDWPNHKPVLEKLISEVEELRHELTSAKSPKKSARVAAEIGDVYFTLAQLCRHLDLDPEIVAGDGNRKFLARFSVVESLARKQKIDIRNASAGTLEGLWNAAKRKE